MVFKRIVKIIPSVELSLTNDSRSRIVVSQYLYSANVSTFKPVVESCIKELQTNLDHFMKVEERNPGTKGDISVHLLVEYTPRK